MNHSPTNTWRVFKFGGASVKDADAVRNAVSLVEHYGQEPLAVVVSAMAKTTNALESVVQALTHGQSAEAEALLASDPFITEGLADLTITEWIPRYAFPGLEAFGG